jgi:hypothetical protein
MDREKPFTEALRIALRSNPLRLRRIAEKPAEKAENGDLAASREIADRLDGKPVPTVDLCDVPVREMTNAQLEDLLAVLQN